MKAMIYGYNFNGSPIPPEIKRRFAERLRLKPKVWGVLAGVGETPQERDAMLLVANNGHRKLHVVERSVANKGIVYGIYTYHE